MKLVYVRGLKGGTAQKWPDDYLVKDISKSETVLQSFDLKPGEDKLDIDELVQRYPLTVVSGDA